MSHWCRIGQRRQITECCDPPECAELATSDRATALLARGLQSPKSDHNPSEF